MKKIFLNESEKKKLISEKEKMIIESFAKNFNKIKRVDENEIAGPEIKQMEKQAFDFANSPEMDGEQLKPQEQKVLDDILNSMDSINEVSFDSFLEKIKNYAKKGMITTGILSALLSTPGMSTAQQNTIKSVVKTEMSSQNQQSGINISKMSNTEVAQLVYDLCLKNPEKAKKLAYGKYNNGDLLKMFADGAVYKNLKKSDFNYFGQRLKHKDTKSYTEQFIDEMSGNNTQQKIHLGGFGNRS
jgi:hypothetical protein